jgi:glycosyltransferase involved in cell wall biosynthesis
VISFIIPAYNEEQHLGATLTALHAAAGEISQPFEIHVVDDASTDRTAAIAIEHGARVTSGRKLGLLSGWQLVKLLVRLAFRGPESFRKREGLELWYEQRETTSKSARNDKQDSGT